MKTIIAYVLVVPLAQFFLTAGLWLGALPIAFLLVWAPISLRTKIAGFCSGIAGVTVAVSCGYGIFRFVIGPGSFTIGAFHFSFDRSCALPNEICYKNSFPQINDFNK
ncbi:MAG: hypothetical protein NTW12_07875 [Deltaproteobacteria bacterium]|nr:hypothetical protein [Deltaproteobacteria bacterium]